MSVDPKSLEIFTQRWLVDFDIAAASESIGISTIEAANLLAEEPTKKLIAANRRAHSEAVNVSTPYVMNGLRALVNADITEILRELGKNDGRSIPEKLSALPADLRFAIKSIAPGKFGLKIELHDKRGALELIGRALQIWSDSVNLTVAQKPEIPGSLDGLSTQEKSEAFAAMVNGPTTH